MPLTFRITVQTPGDHFLMLIELKMPNAASFLGTHLSSHSTGTLQTSLLRPLQESQQLVEAPHGLTPRLLLLQPQSPHPAAPLPAFVA